MAERLKLDFEVLTPLFLGAADQQQSELRPPSLKGLLRFWYRAVIPCGLEDEARLFGGTDSGQSPFLLRIGGVQQQEWRWDPSHFDRFDWGHEKEKRNGLRYLGYPFELSQKKGRGRTGLAPGSRFQLEVIFPRSATVEQRRALLAASWALGHIGGIGSRSRRGFGSLALRGWTPVWKEEQDRLTLLHTSVNQKEWTDGYGKTRKVFGEWFGNNPGKIHMHPHLGNGYRVVLGATPSSDWECVLDGMGRYLQDYRVRKAPDYQRVKDHLTGARRLERCPDRAGFGLPLTFKYNSVKKARPVTFVPYDDEQKTTLERHGSLLHLRVAALADGLHPLFLRLDGAVPGQSGALVAPRGQGRPLRSAEHDILDQFMDHLMGKG